ncbi:hypothetical protein BJ508DRAFT_323179 [Ascobolus immersus RN42]|uniref:Galactose oxidase n=1 Tax=Ascobolus immersus RN42 TaxID=1160509 RepID=A0A3N4IFQ4_ASCIM|nr:hypothetical protein BJ508DRAFT_323179 [Ascobolus immersus RN42]
MRINQSLVHPRSEEPLASLCTWKDGAATTINSTLYLSSGQSTTFSPLLAHPLSESTANFTPIPKPASLDSPNLGNPALWTSSTHLFEFDGANITSLPSSLTFPILDLTTNKWTTLPLPDPYRRHLGGSTQNDRFGFYYKGGANPTTTPSLTTQLFPSDLLIFDFTTRTFTSRPGDPDATKEVTQNVLSYLPFGQNGTLLSFGGVGFNGLITLDKASLYDLASETWYTVPLAGERPSKRIGGCTVTVTAPAGNTTQIFLYGGMDPSAQPGGYDEVYVLSIPAFRWKKVWEGAGKARLAMACTRVGREMLVLGGGKEEQCEEREGERTVFDLTGLEWVENAMLDVDGVYEVNKAVPTQDEPVGGWQNQALRELFSVKTNEQTSPSENTNLISTDGSNPSTDGPEASTDHTQSPPPSNKPAIIGGVVGGVLALLLLLALFFFVRRRRQRRLVSSTTHELPGSAPQHRVREVYKPADSIGYSTTEMESPLPVYSRAELHEATISEMGLTERSVGVSPSGTVMSELPGCVPVTSTVRPVRSLGVVNYIGEEEATLVGSEAINEQPELSSQKTDSLSLFDDSEEESTEPLPPYTAESDRLIVASGLGSKAQCCDSYRNAEKLQQELPSCESKKGRRGRERAKFWRSWRFFAPDHYGRFKARMQRFLRPDSDREEEDTDACVISRARTFISDELMEDDLTADEYVDAMVAVGAVANAELFIALKTKATKLLWLKRVRPQVVQQGDEL